MKQSSVVKIVLVFVISLLSANALSHDADYFEGVKLYKNGDFRSALIHFQKSALKGDPDAQFNVAEMYIRGVGTPKNTAESYKWYKAAADQGVVDASVSLGDMYALGQVPGGEKDYSEAMRLYKFAAGSGNIPATYDIGRMYLFGYGVKKDYGTAAHWFRLAADRGDVYAQFNLGAMYANGDGLVADDVEAYKWLTIASRGGDKAADGVLDKLAEKMPPALISKAIKETDEWMANHPRGPTGFYLGK